MSSDITATIVPGTATPIGNATAIEPAGTKPNGVVAAAATTAGWWEADLPGDNLYLGWVRQKIVAMEH